MRQAHAKRRVVAPKPVSAIKVIQRAGLPLMWQGNKSHRALRSAFFAGLEATKQMLLQEYAYKLSQEKLDTSHLTILKFEKEDA